MKYKLSRQQELALINRGLQSLIDEHLRPTRTPWNKGVKVKKHRWTDEQRDKFRATMRKKYGKRFDKKSGQ